MTEKRLHRIPDDFEATIRILRTDEGGRLHPPFNGIRWDFQYAEDPADQLFMIHPDFFDTDRNSLPTDQPLAIGVELSARMVVLADEMRTKVHQKRLQVGTEFFCKEGQKSVAHGRVTRITGLFTARPNQ
jgi:translation elongation factor EF-Tu-like GTPase